MRRLRFNQIFTLALLLCLISAFAWPAGNRQPWANAQRLFAPVSRPAGQAAAWIMGAQKNRSVDSRNDSDIRTENAQLKVEIAQLEGQLKAVSKMAAERRQLGSLLNYCVSAIVVGGDSDDRQSLNLQQSDPPALQMGQPVVCRYGLVGRIQSAGPGGAKVLLITDKSSQPISVAFGRMVRRGDGSYIFQRLATERTLVYGRGEDQLLAPQGLSLAAAKSVDLRAGDWAVLDDTDDFPIQLAGLCVGQITSLRPSMASPLYTDISIRPATRLEQLREVLVQVRR